MLGCTSPVMSRGYHLPWTGPETGPGVDRTSDRNRMYPLHSPDSTRDRTMGRTRENPLPSPLNRHTPVKTLLRMRLVIMQLSSFKYFTQLSIMPKVSLGAKDERQTCHSLCILILSNFCKLLPSTLLGSKRHTQPIEEQADRHAGPYNFQYSILI